MDIKSPKDGFVEELFVSTGARVAKGTVICKISDDEERQHLERLESMRRILELNASRLGPEQVALRRRAAEIAVGLAEANLTLKNQVSAVKQLQDSLGLVNSLYNHAAKSDVIQATLLRERARGQLEEFEFALERAKATEQEVRARIEPEVQFLRRQIDKLRLTSPADGTITLHAAVGLFVRLGDVVAVLND